MRLRVQRSCVCVYAWTVHTQHTVHLWAPVCHLQRNERPQCGAGGPREWMKSADFFCSLYFLVHLCIVHDIVMGCGDGDRERWLNIGGKCVYIYLATNDSAQNMPFSQMRVCHPYHHLRGHRLFLSIRDSLHRCICIFGYICHLCRGFFISVCEHAWCICFSYMCFYCTQKYLFGPANCVLDTSPMQPACTYLYMCYVARYRIYIYVHLMHIHMGPQAKECNGSCNHWQKWCVELAKRRRRTSNLLVLFRIAGADVAVACPQLPITCIPMIYISSTSYRCILLAVL